MDDGVVGGYEVLLYRLWVGSGVGDGDGFNMAGRNVGGGERDVCRRRRLEYYKGHPFMGISGVIHDIELITTCFQYGL